MTEEQIKQNAEAYAEQHAVRIDGGGYEEEYDYKEQENAYIAGAHSRDEEIEELKKKLEDITKLKNCFASSLDIYDRDNKELQDELKLLRDPWISVEDRLPEKSVGYFSPWVLCRYKRGSRICYHVGMYDYEFDDWSIANVTHWMPIPELSTTK